MQESSKRSTCELQTAGCEKLNGIFICSFREGENLGGGSFPHIQCANDGAFAVNICINDRWCIDGKLKFCKYLHCCIGGLSRYNK
jgi:hypothetical protein